MSQRKCDIGLTYRTGKPGKDDEIKIYVSFGDFLYNDFIYSFLLLIL